MVTKRMATPVMKAAEAREGCDENELKMLGAHDHEQCPGDGDFAAPAAPRGIRRWSPGMLMKCGGDAVAAIRLDDSVEPPDG